jgi:hypothetical protein
MKKYFNFEIYTSDPVTGTTGWKIEMVSVKSETIQEARIKLKDYPFFDCIILFNYSHQENQTADFLVIQDYPKFKILKKITL